MRTPFAYLADRYTLSPRTLRWATSAALVASILIVLGGGIVRVTGSGLGCPTWPACDTSSLTPTPELGIHGVIEFTNRALTGLLCIAVGWAIIAARLQKPQNRSLTRLAWSQFWLVVANALIGGVTVLLELNPYVVAFHFVAAIALLTTSALTWHRAHRGQSPDAALPRSARALSVALVAVTLVLILVGTLVTGSGPHSGDSADVPRMAFDWAGVTVVHGVLGTATLVLAVILLVVLRRTPGAELARQRTVTFVVVVILQAGIGLVQSLIGLPEVLVALHLLGAALVWVGVLRVLLDVNPQLFAEADGRGAKTAQPNLVG
ncbi:COX15/CtaA family protein [Compostimonas suwonensis]|uniref:Cytochrome c oxidase assembly protein subunit 15 n=1 Tax=Compostimonas suwonensis TaxID=1048394 RepID=A0A2M9BYN2_9MICO|nr:COX15/CtaA family protein [Compostimonas suwonensis]PJJ63193.1 cytochrome c oxidase assembly protein subunit 15 [Compostimonas suwonensis]